MLGGALLYWWRGLVAGLKSHPTYGVGVHVDETGTAEDENFRVGVMLMQ